MRARIYTRVSTDEQVEGYSIEVQDERCRAYILSQGWTVEGVTSDEGYSGFYDDRPGLVHILKLAADRQFDVIVVYKIDRFSRKLQDLLNIADLLEKTSVALKSVTEPFDTITSHGKLQFQILGSFAEFERNRLKERVFPGMAKGVTKGNWQGARYAPYGYRYDKVEKMLIEVPEESVTVRSIFELALEGYSITAIVKHLNRDGIINHRTGKAIQFSLVRNILKNPIYTGKIIWNKHGYLKNVKIGKTFKYAKKDEQEWVTGQGKHVPLITDEHFDLVQTMINQRYERLKKIGIFVSPDANHTLRNIESDHILSGILSCDCGESMYGDRVISNRIKKIYKRRYFCTSRTKYGKPCGNPTVYAENIEGEVINLVEKIIKFPLCLDKLTGKLAEDIIEGDSTISSQIEYLKKQYQQNRHKLEKLVREFIDPENDVDRNIFDKIAREVKEEGRGIEDKIKQLKRRVEVSIGKKTIERFLSMLNNFETLWQRFSNEEKKSFLRSMFRKITVKNKQIIYIEFKEPFNEIMEAIEKDEHGTRGKEVVVYQDIRLPDECS